MSKITNRFVHFKTKASFTSRLGAGDIQESSVVFIQDANEIWTHGTYYKCDISEAEVIALINSKGYITEADIPSLTGGAAATSGQYVSGVTVSGHNVTVTKAALPTSVSGNAGTATKLATSRVIAIAGAVQGSATFDGSSDVSINSTLNGFDASKITSGTINADRLPEIPISKIPAAAMERLYVVESQSAAMSLTIQEGDVVQIGSGGPMYFCVSESASTFATKFKVFTAGAATSVPWSGVTNAPTLSSRSLLINAASYQVYSRVAASIPMIYAPTEIGTSGQILQSTGNGAPKWVNQSSLRFLPLSGGNLTGDLRIISNFTVDGETELNNNLWLGGDFVPSDSNQYSIGLELYKFKAAYINETYSTNFYMGDSKELVATQSWVTGRGYLTSIPAATSSAYGGIQIGYTTSGKNYAVQLSNGKAYVNVPWTDTNTNYYPTTFTWTNGTTAGPTGSLTGVGMSAVSFNAIPVASATQSGVVTTGDQSFAGEKTFMGGISAQDADISDLIIGSSLEFNAFGRFNYIATSTEAGGIKIGATASGVNLPLVLNSSNQAYIAVTKGAVTAALGFTPANVNDIPEIPITLPNPYALNVTAGGSTTSYTGSSASTIDLDNIYAKKLPSVDTPGKPGLYFASSGSVNVTEVYVTENNPDAIILVANTVDVTFGENYHKMDGIDSLSGGNYKCYCITYVRGVVLVNGAIYG